jgi:hypothetical protein
VKDGRGGEDAGIRRPLVASSIQDLAGIGIDPAIVRPKIRIRSKPSSVNRVIGARSRRPLHRRPSSASNAHRCPDLPCVVGQGTARASYAAGGLEGASFLSGRLVSYATTAFC